MFLLNGRIHENCRAETIRSSDETAFFGASKGKKQLRLEIEGCEGDKYLIAVKRSLGYFTNSNKYIKVEVQTKESREYVYINKNSLKKRLCDTQKNYDLLTSILPSHEKADAIFHRLFAHFHPEVHQERVIAELSQKTSLTYAECQYYKWELGLQSGRDVLQYCGNLDTLRFGDYPGKYFDGYLELFSDNPKFTLDLRGNRYIDEYSHAYAHLLKWFPQIQIRLYDEDEPIRAQKPLFKTNPVINYQAVLDAEKILAPHSEEDIVAHLHKLNALTYTNLCAFSNRLKISHIDTLRLCKNIKQFSFSDYRGSSQQLGYELKCLLHLKHLVSVNLEGITEYYRGNFKDGRPNYTYSLKTFVKTFDRQTRNAS